MIANMKDKRKDKLQSAASGVVVQGPPDIVCWPEWTDAEVNSEKWEIATLKKAHSKKEKKKTASEKSTRAGKSPEPERPQFKDPQPVPLPHSLRTSCSWVRPEKIFAGMTTVVFLADSDPVADLVSPNWHLMHSTFVRSFVSAVAALEYLGRTVCPPVEWQTSTYTATTSGAPWKPWHHIYSGCRAGKDARGHSPQPNLAGKYFVRLYWLGCWRRVVVDDRLPVADGSLDDGRPAILVPTAATAANRVQLWPVLLAKALLKLASLTWTDSDELVDIDLLVCMTGWPAQCIDTRKLNPMDVWRMCCAYCTDNYSWNEAADERLRQYCTGERKVGVAASAGRDTARSKTRGGKTKSKTGRSKSQPKKAAPRGPTRFLFGSCAQLTDDGDPSGVDMLPCLPHEFVVTQVRDIVCMPELPDPSTELQPWKKIRWEDWAERRGLRQRVVRPRRRLLRLFSGLRRQSREAVFQTVEPSQLTRTFQRNVELADFVALDKTLPEFAAQPKTARSGSRKSSKSPSKSRSKSGGSKGKSKKAQPRMDTSVWCEFDWFVRHIEGLKMYFIPSEYHTCVISNRELHANPSKQTVSKKDVKKKKGKAGVESEQYSRRYIQWRGEVREECFYLFLDSCCEKRVVVSVSTACCPFPSKDARNPPEVEPAQQSASDKRPARCHAGMCVPGCGCQLLNGNDSIEPLPADNRRKVYFLAEHFNWQTDRIGKIEWAVGTPGTRALLLWLSPGRYVLRCWISDPAEFVVTFLCDVPIAVNGLEATLVQMVTESELVTKTYYDICTTFSNLVAGFGTARYVEFLHLFRRSYLAGSNLPKLAAAAVHHAFLQQLLDMLCERCAYRELPSVVRALRVLFLEPDLGVISDDSKPRRRTYLSTQLSRENQSCLCEEDCGQDAGRRDLAAARIQAFFKRIYIQQLHRKHDPTHPEFFHVFEDLKRVYMTIFSSERRKTTGPELVRRLAADPNIELSAHHFTYYRDLGLVLCLQRQEGTVPAAEPNSWLLLTQLTFVCKGPTEAVRLHATCDLPVFVMRVFNTDNGNEITNTSSYSFVAMFNTEQENGYCAMVYGWTCNRTTASLPWRLTLVSQRRATGPTVELRPVTVAGRVLSDTYIPSRTLLICRCILRISETTIISFRLCSSSKYARMKLRCVNAEGSVLAEVTGGPAVVLPAVRLLSTVKSDTLSYSSKKLSNASKRSSIRVRSQRDLDTIDESTQFFIEVLLEENTWPLTRDEEKRSNARKACDSLEYEVCGGLEGALLESSKKSLVRGRTTVQLAGAPVQPAESPPRWMLCAVFDKSCAIGLDHDLRRRDQIRAIKRTFFGEDLERLYWGKKLREEFIEEYITGGSLIEDSEQSLISGSTSVVSMLLCPVCGKTVQEDISDVEQGTDESNFLLEMDIEHRYGELRHVISETEEEMMNDQWQSALETFEENQQCFLQNMDNYLLKTLQDHENLKYWYEDIRADSAAMMASVDELRAQSYATMITKKPKSPKAKSPKKGKKAK